MSELKIKIMNEQQLENVLYNLLVAEGLESYTSIGKEDNQRLRGSIEDVRLQLAKVKLQQEQAKPHAKQDVALIDELQNSIKVFMQGTKQATKWIKN